MNITDVKTDIKNKIIKPYYIFAGEEIEIQRIYVEKIAQVLGYKVIRPECIADVWNSIITPTLFDTPAVYVVRDDKDLMQDEVLQNQIAQNNLNGNIIIHLLTTLDKRTKYYKSNSDKIVLFERLTTDMLLKYCQRITTLNKRNSERLIDICEHDYSRILLEIDKIKAYRARNTTLTDDQIFEQFVEDGTIAIPPQDAVFDLVDAILKRNIKQSYYLLDQCKQIGEANMVILSVLYTNAKQVLQVQACESPDIVKSTGLTPFQVKCAKEKCGNYYNDELIDMLRLIQKIQKGIITGQIEDDLSVNYLLVNIL